VDDERKEPVTMDSIPADFDYLDPDRPEVLSEGDLSPQEREQDAVEIRAMHERASRGIMPPSLSLSQDESD
jgi:hypothetical protein